MIYWLINFNFYWRDIFMHILKHILEWDEFFFYKSINQRIYQSHKFIIFIIKIIARSWMTKDSSFFRAGWDWKLERNGNPLIIGVKKIITEINSFKFDKK